MVRNWNAWYVLHRMRRQAEGRHDYAMAEVHRTQIRACEAGVSFDQICEIARVARRHAAAADRMHVVAAYTADDKLADIGSAHQWRHDRYCRD